MNFQPLEVAGIALVDNVSSTFFFLSKNGSSTQVWLCKPLLAAFFLMD